MIRKIYLLSALLLSSILLNAQVIDAFEDDNASPGEMPAIPSKTVTDTVFFHEFYSLPGVPLLTYYNYSNGNGYFYGTNFMDLDQDPTTPLENGSLACAQGYKVNGPGYHIEKILVRVGFKSKTSPFGSPLLLSVRKLDGESNYTVNTSGGTQTYTIDAPGTGLGSAAIPYDSIVAGFGEFYSVGRLSPPVWVDEDYCVMADFTDFYLNGDRIGLFASSVNGNTINGPEYTLWHYPSPFLWLQVTHVYTSMTRAIAIFPVIDDGTASLEESADVGGVRLSQNYPNPCQGSTTVDYEIPEAADVRLMVLDMGGRTVFTLEQGWQEQGSYSAGLDLHHLSSGNYYYVIEAGTRRMGRVMSIIP